MKRLKSKEAFPDYDRTSFYFGKAGKAHTPESLYPVSRI